MDILSRSALRVRLNGHRNDRLGERDRFEQNRMVFVANRVAGRDVLQTNQRANVTRVTHFDVLAMIGVHFQQASDALALVVARVIDRHALSDLAGINPEENQFASVRISPNLERQRAERAVVVGGAGFGFACVSGLMPTISGNIQRRRQIIDHGIEQRLDALVLERRATDHRHKLVLDGQPANTRLQLIRC